MTVTLAPGSATPVPCRCRLAFSVGLLLTGLWLGGCQSGVQPESTRQEKPTLVVSQRSALHREVWKTVFDYYYDPDLNGVDWVNVGRETHEMLAAAEDVEAVYAVLKTMVEHLGDPHTYVLSPAEVSALETSGFVGVGITSSEHESMEGVSVVLRVSPESPAATAGIEPGWLWLNAREVHAQSLTLGSVTTYRFLDDHEQIQELSLESAIVPKANDQREVRWVDEQLLYLRFDYFEEGIAEWMAEVLAQHTELRGLILDVRWNPGGFKRELDAMLALLLPENSAIGSVVTRRDRLLPEFTPSVYARPPVNVPVAVLVSPYSASSSEILAAVIRHHQRGPVVGTGRTSGQVLFSPAWKLPAGGLLKVAARDYLSPDGKRLQGSGVEPDVLTDPRSFFEFRRGVDPTLSAAVERLRGNGKWVR